MKNRRELYLLHPGQRRSRTNVVFFGILRFVFWFLSRPFVWIYSLANFVFKLDEAGAARNLRRLMDEVEVECGALFEKYGGRIVTEKSAGSPSFDFASVVVEIRSLTFMASRDRGYTHWRVSHGDSEWQPLEFFCQPFASELSYRSALNFKILLANFPQIEEQVKRESIS